MSDLRLGTRGSQLALWQANQVASRIRDAGGPACRVVVIKTAGDRLQEAPLSEIGGKRLFVKEIEDALLRGEVDLAVHSSKDMPAVLPEGLAIGAVLPRENPLDAVVLPEVRLKPDTTDASAAAVASDPGRTPNETPVVSGSSRTTDASAAAVASDPGRTPNEIPVVSGFSRTSGGAVATIDDLIARLGPSPSIGTGSVRRIAQLVRLFPGARFTPIRGNLDTRLRKLDEGGYDALVLAAAGLSRLGFGHRITLALPASACVPAPGQGIVAVELREDDRALCATLARIDDRAAHAALDAERALVAALGGGCQTPIGALASPADATSLELVAVVVALDGSRAVRKQVRGAAKDAEALGAQLAAQLLADGAGEILAEAQSRLKTEG